MPNPSQQNKIPLSTLLSDPDYLSASPEDRAVAMREFMALPHVYDDRGQSGGRGSGIAEANGPENMSALERNIKGFPMGVSKSAGKLVAGTAKMAGAPVSDEFMAALDPEEGEGAGAMVGDVATSLAMPVGGSMVKGAPRFKTLLRAIESGVKGGLTQGALTAARTGGDMAAAKDDALMAGGISGGMPLLGAGMQAGGRKIASFTIPQRTAKEVLAAKETLIPEILEGGVGMTGNSSLDRFLPKRMRNKHELVDEMADRAKKSGANTESFIRSGQGPGVMETRSEFKRMRDKFAKDSKGQAAMNPQNPNFMRQGGADPGIRSSARAPMAQVDDTLRELLADAQKVGGKSRVNPMDSFNVARSAADDAKGPLARGTEVGASEKQRVALRTSATIRKLLKDANPGLNEVMGKNAKDIAARDLSVKALNQSSSGASARNDLWRQVVSALAFLSSPSPTTAAVGGMIAFPRQTARTINTLGKASKSPRMARAASQAVSSSKKKEEEEDK